MTNIFAPVIQNDRLSGEPVALFSSSGGKKCTRLRRSLVNFWASWGFSPILQDRLRFEGMYCPPHNDALANSANGLCSFRAYRTTSVFAFRVFHKQLQVMFSYVAVQIFSCQLGKMKYSTLFYCIFCSFGSIYAQVDYTYSPDNSQLTIILDESTVLDLSRTQLELDLKDRWRYKKCNEVKITIRGACFFETNPDTLTQTTLNIEMFGKSFTRKIYSNKDFIEEFTRPGRFLYKRPRIIISVLDLNAEGKIFIDTIDMSANKYPSKQKR